MNHLLEVEGLCKTFRGGLFEKNRQVLTDVSFRLPEGATIGFVGGNGHGKTTTIKCLFGFIRPDKGRIRVFGKLFDPAVRAQIGYMPERPYLYEFLTGIEFLKLHWELAGFSPRKGFQEAAERVLALVDLRNASTKSLRTYSKGMLQRIGLAQALIHEPRFLILDEPMSGLDPDGRAIVKDILRDQKRKGITVFFSSHLLQDMDELCDHLTVIDHGRIVHDGTPESFRKHHPDLEKAFTEFRRGRHE